MFISPVAELLILRGSFVLFRGWFYKSAQSAAHPTDTLCFLFLFSHNNFVAILDLPEGEHQYKFFVDGQWTHDPSEVCFLPPQSSGCPHDSSTGPALRDRCQVPLSCW